MKKPAEANPRIDRSNKELFDYMLNMEQHKLFTITVVFRSSGDSPQESKWVSYYKKNVLHKIRRRLASSKAKQERSIPIDWIAQYEHEHRSIYTSDGSSLYPHHIHGLIPIHSDLVYRIFDEDKQSFDEKLIRDLETTKLVSSVKIEPHDQSRGYAWINYMTKGKFPDQYSWSI